MIVTWSWTMFCAVDLKTYESLAGNRGTRTYPCGLGTPGRFYRSLASILPVVGFETAENEASKVCRIPGRFTFGS